MKSEPKCPACRKRFVVNPNEPICARCGADLSLLIRLRLDAMRLVLDAFSAPEKSPAGRLALLHKAQSICRSEGVPEVQSVETVS